MSYNGAILQSIVTRAVGIHQQLQEVCWLAVREGQCSSKWMTVMVNVLGCNGSETD